MQIAVNNTTIHCEIIGQGPSLVLIHGGFGLDHNYFRPHLDSLSQQFQLIYFDVRGNGQSAQVDLATITMPQIIADLEAVRAHLAIEQWAVLGHSGGSLIAGSYAAHYPDRTSHLISLCGFPFYPFEAPDWVRSAVEADTPDYLQAMQNFRTGLTSDSHYRENFMALAPLFFATSNPANLAAFDAVRFRYDAFNALVAQVESYSVPQHIGTFTGPMAIIHGAQDIRVPVAEGLRWLELLPHAQTHLLEGTGHYPFVEDAQATCAAITAVLNG